MEQVLGCLVLSLNFIGEVTARVNLLLWTCGLIF